MSYSASSEAIGLAIDKWVHDKEFMGDIEAFEVNGQILFPLYGTTGGITSCIVLYLMRKCEDKAFADVVGVQLPALFEENAPIDAVIKDILHASLELFEGAYHKVNVDGGDLGLPYLDYSGRGIE